MNLRSLALGLPLLWICAAAQAQVVPHGALGAGVQAPPSARTGNTVARSQSELDQLGFTGISGVDFQRDMVLAIVLGPQISQGNAVRVAITRVTRQGQDLEVRYRVSRPSGFGVPIVSRPFVLVTTARTSGAVRFAPLGAALPTPTPSPGLLPPGRLPFHVVSHGSTSADLPSGQHLFHSAAELRQSGYEALVPDPSSIRWSQEMVAVILAGQADYRVRALSLRGSLTVPSGGRLTLDYELSRVFPTSARWYQVVRFPRVADLRFAERLPAGLLKGEILVTSAFGVSVVSLKAQGGQRYVLQPQSLARELEALEGETVILDGQKTGTALLRIKRLVSPEPFQGGGRLVGVPGKARLAQVGLSLNLSGPLVPALETGIGRNVSRLRGYRFADRRLLVTEFAAYAKRPAQLTVNGAIVAQLSTGQPVRVRGQGTTGLYVVPSRQGLPGYVAADVLSFSQIMPPLITLGSGTPTTATTAPGITGTVKSSGPR